MNTRQPRDWYSNQAAELDHRLGAAIKAAKELQKRTDDLEREFQGSLQLYHREKSEIQEFLAGLYSTSGTHASLPADGTGEAREKKGRMGISRRAFRKADGWSSSRDDNRMTATRCLPETAGFKMDNGYDKAMNKEESDCLSFDSDGDDVEGSLKYYSTLDANVECDGTGETHNLGERKLPNMSQQPCEPTRTSNNARTTRKFDIATFRRRFAHCVRDYAFDPYGFTSNVTMVTEKGKELRGPPLTTSSSIGTCPNELRGKIQRWCATIGSGDWSQARATPVDNKNIQDSSRCDDLHNHSHSFINNRTTHPQDAMVASTFLQQPPSLRARSRQKSPGSRAGATSLSLPSRPRSRRSSRGSQQMPSKQHTRRNMLGADSADAVVEACDVEFMDVGFALEGTRVVRKATLPASRLVKDGDLVADPLVPRKLGRESPPTTADRRVHFAMNNDPKDSTRLQCGLFPVIKPHTRSHSDPAIVTNNAVDFRVNNPTHNSSSAVVVEGNDVRRIRPSHHSHHECKVYRGSRTLIMNLGDPEMLARQARAHTRLVQRQRARARRESYSYSTNAGISAALNYDRAKWSM